MARNFDRSLILYEREFLCEPAVYNLKSYVLMMVAVRLKPVKFPESEH
jgi:hypothetical protein